ncbi:hypothetical protein EZ428_02750 [Pedobacter frigiditerrae]|uniref:Lipocalin-like domain-containing protein n=1 Tax=Pedobacter frigiditerrae TaxID=2530452 RepID=A0A4R0N2W9_9SPHI|nr:hypothetical protein [Pedobacter frigiditerrae]TCC93707.1 hypothetical protein EZ428_02750 [Pedobacter frigiditerrae]
MKVYIVIALIIFSLVSCKKENSSSSATKVELLTKKSWVQTSSEIYNDGISKWETYNSSTPRVQYYFFYADGTAERKENTGGTTYTVISKGSWSFANNEKTLKHSFFTGMLDLSIDELSETRLQLSGFETGTNGDKFRYTYVHP